VNAVLTVENKYGALQKDMKRSESTKDYYTSAGAGVLQSPEVPNLEESVRENHPPGNPVSAGGLIFGSDAAEGLGFIPCKPCFVVGPIARLQRVSIHG